MSLALQADSLQLSHQGSPSENLLENNLEVNIKSHWETYTPPYVNEIASGSALCDAGSSTPVLRDNEGCDRAEVTWRFKERRDPCRPMADSCCYTAETSIIKQ